MLRDLFLVIQLLLNNLNPVSFHENWKATMKILTREYDLEYGKILTLYKVTSWKKIMNFFLILDNLLPTGWNVNCVSRLL